MTVAKRQPAASPVSGASDRPTLGLGRSHPSLRDLITDELRQAILGGKLAPGTRLVEDRLAMEFGVSRNPIREALRSLETEGLLEVIPRRGTFVASLGTDELQEITELRAVLEGLSAKLAARRVTPEMRQRIEDMLARGERAAATDDADALRDLNNEFHSFLAEAGRNRFLADFMRSLRDRTHWMYLSSISWRRTEAWSEHASILRAIGAGDEELASILANRHVVRAVDAYSETVRHQHDGSGSDAEDEEDESGAAARAAGSGAP